MSLDYKSTPHPPFFNSVFNDVRNKAFLFPLLPSRLMD